VAALDAEPLQQAVHVVREHVERVFALGCVAFTVAAGVEAQHLEIAPEHRACSSHIEESQASEWLISSHRPSPSTV